MLKFKMNNNIEDQTKTYKFKFKYFILIIFFIIGFFCVLFGCSPNGYCLLYDIHEGTIYDNNIVAKTCRGSCKEKSGKQCVKYRYYDCFDMHIKMEYTNKNKLHTCSKKVKSKVNLRTTERSLHKYTINKTLDIVTLKNKYSKTCIYEESKIRTWHNGIAFLSVSIILGLCLSIYECANSNNAKI